MINVGVLVVLNTLGTTTVGTVGRLVPVSTGGGGYQYFP
jgi:hypothetical protein